MSAEEKFSITMGNCTVELDTGCVASPEWNLSEYPTNTRCEVRTNEAGTLRVAGFELEPPYFSEGSYVCKYDYVLVGGFRYCGAEGPHGVVVSAGDDLAFISDASLQYPGFLLCLDGGIIDEAANATDKLSSLLQNVEVQQVVLAIDLVLERPLPTLTRSLSMLGKCFDSN
eukprot:gene27593-biopygen28613